MSKHEWWSSHLTFVVKTDNILPPLMSKQTLLITSVFNLPRSVEDDYTVHRPALSFEINATVYAFKQCCNQPSG